MVWDQQKVISNSLQNILCIPRHSSQIPQRRKHCPPFTLTFQCHSAFPFFPSSSLQEGSHWIFVFFFFFFSTTRKHKTTFFQQLSSKIIDDHNHLSQLADAHHQQFPFRLSPHFSAASQKVPKESETNRPTTQEPWSQRRPQHHHLQSAIRAARLSASLCRPVLLEGRAKVCHLRH